MTAGLIWLGGGPPLRGTRPDPPAGAAMNWQVAYIGGVLAGNADNSFTAGDPAPALEETLTVTITYTYDPLYRLTAADYSTGEYFYYINNSVGNRLMQEMQDGTKTYAYDDERRQRPGSRIKGWGVGGVLIEGNSDVNIIITGDNNQIKGNRK